MIDKLEDKMLPPVHRLNNQSGVIIDNKKELMSRCIRCGKRGFTYEEVCHLCRIKELVADGEINPNNIPERFDPKDEEKLPELLIL